MLSRRTQIARLRQVAGAGLDAYPLSAGRLRFVDHGENTTFRLACAEGEFLVRVHRPERHGRGDDGRDAVASELAWLAALRADGRVQVPEPVPATDGAATARAHAAGETRTVSVLRWQPGRIFEETARPVHLHRLGEAMAQLHLQADAWTPPAGFTRIDWNHEAFFGDVMVYGGLPAGRVWELLPAGLRDRCTAVADRLLPLIDPNPDYGLIHADLHLGNAVFQGDRVKLIDFDDCGTGPRLYDVAVALWELRERDDYPSYQEALLAGYRSHRAVDITRLDDFIALRQVAVALWYTGTAQVNPAFAEQLDVVNGWSLDMLDLVEAS